MKYIEQDCSFEHNGKKFESGGAMVGPERIVAYPGKLNGSSGPLQDWHGKKIGTYVITSTWKTPRSYMSLTQSQIYALVDGIIYQGKGAGAGMIWRGKAANAKLPSGVLSILKRG